MTLSLLTLGAVQPLPDTVVMVVSRDALGIAADLSLVILGVALLSGVIAGIGSLVALRRGVQRARTWSGGVQADPSMAKARLLVDHLEAIASTLRDDAQRLSYSVQALSDRLEQASGHMEERIDDFNALLEVVQEEAESVFIRTASGVRGVREAARVLSHRRGEGVEEGEVVEEGKDAEGQEPVGGRAE
jgi:hypothetical protein